MLWRRCSRSRAPSAVWAPPSTASHSQPSTTPATRASSARARGANRMDRLALYPRPGVRQPARRGTLMKSALDEVGAAALAAGEPARGDGLLARVELDRVGAVGVQVAEERVLPAREREEGDGRGDADVDADHARLDLVAVAPDRRAGLREDRRAVAEPARVHELDRLVERGDADDRDDRAEDLLLGGLGAGLDAVEDRRAHEGTGPLRFVAAVDDDVRAVGAGLLDRGADPVARGLRDDRADVDALLEPVADPQRFGGRAQRADQLLVRLADRDHDRAGHAALARGAERRADDAVDGLVDHRVGHHDHVVLGPAQRLHALARGGGALVDDPRHGGRADEGDRVDA